MVRGLEVDAAPAPFDAWAGDSRPFTRTWVRVSALAAYVVLLAVWVKLLGIPNDTVQVSVWLWFGTIACHAAAPWRYHLRFPRDWALPIIGLTVYFYSRGVT